MRSFLLQLIAVTTINLKSIPQRLWLSLSTVIATPPEQVTVTTMRSRESHRIVRSKCVRPVTRETKRIWM